MSDLIGQRLGQYEILAVLGRGGMAVVYRARQESMKRDVAVKVIKTNLAQVGDFLDRFSREAEMVARLSHPHILKVFDYGQQDDQVYLVMELLTGGSLAGMIKQGPLPLAIAARALDQVGSALDHAHRRGIIHRDPLQNTFRRGRQHLPTDGIAKLINDTTS
jgi:serine/threonine-protein kinase